MVPQDVDIARRKDMQLVVDVGNTETVIGLTSSTRDLISHWRVSSSAPRTSDETTVLVRGFLSDKVTGDLTKRKNL